MKKLNTNSVFFRLAVLFIVTLISIITIIFLTVHFLRDENPFRKSFLTPIAHIQKILTDIEEGKEIRKIIKKKNGKRNVCYPAFPHKSFRRFSVSVFEGGEIIHSDQGHGFSLQEFQKNARSIEGFENTFKYKGNSYLVFRKQNKMIILGNRRRGFRKKGIRFKMFLISMLLPVIIILLVLYFFIRKLLKPVNELLPALSEVRRGNFDCRIESFSDNEFRVIVEAFNEMVSQIKVMFENNLLLIGNISHDLRYYLTRMKMQVEVEIDDDEARKSFNEDLDQMTDYIDRAVEVYRTNSNRNRFVPEKTDLTDLIMEKYRGADIIIDQLDENVTAFIDPGYFSLILDNLYDNAHKYGIPDESGNRVTLSLKKIFNMFELTVSNQTGLHFGKGDLNRLFQPFYRMDVSRNQEIKGSGLGLFIVKQIADSMSLDVKLSADEKQVFSVSISGELLTCT